VADCEPFKVGIDVKWDGERWAIASIDGETLTLECVSTGTQRTTEYVNCLHTELAPSAEEILNMWRGSTVLVITPDGVVSGWLSTFDPKAASVYLGHETNHDMPKVSVPLGDVVEIATPWHGWERDLS
jgi:hypothetical protein